MKPKISAFVMALTNCLTSYIGRFDSYTISVGTSNIYLSMEQGIRQQYRMWSFERLEHLSKNEESLNLEIMGMLRELEK